MTLLRRYCLGDRPVAVEFLSDQAENFQHCMNPVVNYEDPNLNISIPVYSIHGNHDDPSGFGRIATLDLLSASGLINYFGKWTDLTQIHISPLLLQKGTSRLAIYGLSYIKDERLSRLYKDRKVTMLRPKEYVEDWFNIMVLHQNRVMRGAKNYVPETAIDKFVDLVIWGHEHECRVDPELNPEQGFYVIQPGTCFKAIGHKSSHPPARPAGSAVCFRAYCFVDVTHRDWHKLRCLQDHSTPPTPLPTSCLFCKLIQPLVSRG
ncbi:Double-strand break repair protein mre11a [Homalodisca vitripennis]|nr:Double-strand break repair protein mre11a [Homalodisca vitripennis]